MPGSIQLQSVKEGVVLPVKAQAGARRAEIRGVQAGRLKVSVTEAAEKGKANRAIVALLSKSLGVPKSQIEILSGQSVSEKRLLIREITLETVKERLARATRSG